jgi:L-2-hydroxyglutarate oxidase LhgO
MKAGEIKLRLTNSAMELIDTYFGANSMQEKFINATLKIISKQNIYKVDSMLAFFADKDGDIDFHEMVSEYANVIDENGVTFDLKKFVDDETIKKLIPNKILIIKREDIINLLN